MVYVPAGNFLMGSPEGVGDADENPQHTVYLDAYWIDETEVTNSMYQKCVSTGFCTEPSDKSSYTRPSYYGNPDYANYPVIYVNWNQAAQYCSWAKRRLPTEAQWEKAARGENGLIYPWGNESPTGNLVNFADASSNLSFADNSINDGFADTSPVGSFPQGASPYGALNMAGNVWEWVADFYSDSYYFESSNGGSSIISNPFGPGSGDQYVFRGGSWYSTIRLLRTANRNWDIPTQVFHNLGFRCAMPAN